MTETITTQIGMFRASTLANYDVFCKDYEMRGSWLLGLAYHYRMELRELESNHDKAASQYYSMCEKKEQVDQEIEKAI